MVGLAIQYGLQTHFQHKYMGKDVSKLSAILVCEVIKLVISSCALCVENFGARRTGGANKGKGKGKTKGKDKDAGMPSYALLKSVMLCSIPALIYVVQNLCVQTAYGELNPITFNCLNQTKLITTAIALYTIKGVKQNRKQMVALGLVSSGAMLLSLKDTVGNDSNASSVHGIALILAAAVLSGVAATVTQIFMQDMKLSPFLVTLSMCLVSIVTVGCSIVMSSTSTSVDSLVITFFENWEVHTVIPVATQALGGLLVGLVTNYCGSLDKGIAFVCGLAVSASLDVGALTATKLVALLFVAQGSWMHTKESQAKKMKLKRT
jgi:UDP-sugar transporter A1/2/3